MDTVHCPSCGEENPAKFRLCGYCGTSLAPPESVNCPSCGEENPGKFRLCGFCGTPLQGAMATPPRVIPGGLDALGQAGMIDPNGLSAVVPQQPAPPAPPVAPLPSGEVRKPATFIFVDLKGSTALGETIDAEALGEIKKRYFGAMAAQIERHGGTVEKYIGDAIMAVFGVPRAHEDDALRAVRAATGMQEELVRLNEEFRAFYGVELANRTGVNTGEVVASTDEHANQQLATGDTVNVAARLEQAAPPNEILIGETTFELVRAHVEVEPVEPLELKGKAERVPAFRLLAVLDPTAESGRVVRRTVLIGREAELERLGAALEAVTSGGGCRLVSLVGEPGVGKSRLVDDFAASVAERATLLRGRCLPYGDGITFWPLVEIARDAGRIAVEDSPEAARAKLGALLEDQPDAAVIVDRISSAIGLSTMGYPVAEIFWAARRFIETLGARRPIVLLLEDIHFAEPTFLDLVEHLRETVGSGASVLILAAARLALLERRPAFATDPGADRLILGPLIDDEAERFVEALLGGQVQPELRSRVVRVAEGNPLFIEQLVSMLVDKGHVRPGETGWVTIEDVSTLPVPPTIQALLASRLDDLTREERVVVEPASVIGLVFAQPAVVELVPEAVKLAVPTHLAALDRKHLLHRETDSADDEAYRFRNLLIRDATYGSLLKRARAQMHERFVTWAERVNKERGREEEFEEILGYHLEQAYRYRTELGPIDAEGRNIAARAAEKLANAGRRAFARGDLPAAVGLFRRATELLPPSFAERVELLADLGEAQITQGAFEDAIGVLDIAGEEAAAAEDPRLVARVGVVRLLRDVYAASPEGGVSRIIEEAKGHIETLGDRGDQAGLARAWRLVMTGEFTLGHLSEAAAAADKVVAHASAVGDRRLASRSAPAIAYVLVHGPTPVPEAIERAHELLASIQGDRKNEAIAHAALAQLQAMAGSFDEARSSYRRGQAILAELGAGLEASATSIESSLVELLAGDLEAAEQELRRDDATLAAIDEHYFRSTVTSILANVLAQAGKADEAVHYSELGESLADADDMWSQVAWRTGRSRVLAAQGDGERARQLVDEAIALVAATEDLPLRAETLAARGEVLRLIGATDEAIAPLREALALCEAKGDRASAARIAQQLEGVAAA